MGKYINFGKYNRNYKYVILEFVFMILKYYLPTILREIFLKYEIINDYTEYFFYHTHMIDNFRFFGMLIFSLIFYIYEKKSSKNISNNGKSNDLISGKGCFEVIKINDERKKNINNKKNLLNILIIIAICLIIQLITEIITPLIIFSYWMIILLILSYINAKMFKLETYKHQKLAIYFTFINTFVFQLTSFILGSISEEESDGNIYRNYLGFWLLPLGIIIYFVYVSLISYVYSKIKWFMDLQFISLPKLFMIYSVLGLFINIIYCVILTYIKCEGKASDYYCFIEDDGGGKYVENFYEFFIDISYLYGKNKNYLIYMIIIICVDIISNSLFCYYFFLILKNLSPEFNFFIGSIVEIFIKIIQIFKNKIFYNYYFVENGEDYKIPLIKFILTIIGNSLAFIGFLVYSEIIELNFYDFNYNIRRKIIERSIEDSIQRMSINDDQNSSLIYDYTSNRNTELSNNTLKY